MRELAESLSAPGLAIEFTAAGEWGTPENAVELVCYRAFQEGITNAVRHSGAGRVRATLQRSASGVELTVADTEDAVDLRTLETAMVLPNYEGPARRVG